jgi:hypothetical protein
MEWVLDHLQALFFIAIAVVAVLQKLKQARGGRDAGAAPPPAVAAEEAERTRRIQEEIRRKIMERRGQAPATPPPVEEEPGFPAAPPMIEEVRPVVVEPPPLAPAEQAAVAYGAEIERQEQMLRQLRDLETARLAQCQTAAAETAAAATVSSRAGEARPWTVRRPGGLRQAMVWREILGPPVGLR